MRANNDTVANERVTAILLEIADLLDLEGVKFKPEAYRRAARALQQSPEETEELVRTGRIDQVPGVGEAISEKVREFVKTGEVHYLEKLRSQWPPGLLELMRLEGVGPKTTRRFYLEFQVKGPEDLKRLIQEKKLEGVFGFGPRKIELLQRALSKGVSPAGAGPESGRTPLPEAQRRMEELLESLRESQAPFEKLVFAGSLRRRRETVGDLDLLATSSRPREVMERFTHLPQVEEVRLSGDTKSTVVLTGGLQVDLRVVPSEAFGAALQYFTGSKDHNVRLRALANRKGLSINEYGLTRDEQLLPAPTEEEVYAAVGLSWIPPELRENQGEIEAAQEGELPAVVGDADLKGELHIHVPPSIEPEDLLPWVEELRALHLVYGGFVVRASEVDREDRTLEQLRNALPREVEGVRVFLGLEVTLDPKTRPTAPAGADYLVLRPPEKPLANPKESARAWTSPPSSAAAMFAHVDPGSLASAGLEWKDLLPEEGEENGLPLELAVRHDVVATETALVRGASRRSARFVLSGAPRSPEELPRLLLAAGIARRAWTPSHQVVNASSEPMSALRSPANPPSASPKGHEPPKRSGSKRRDGPPT